MNFYYVKRYTKFWTMAKTGRQFWTLVLLMTTVFSISEALRCLSCDHVNNPQECNHIVTCPSYQECVTEQKVSASGIQYFRLGCEDKVNCGMGGSTAIGKKRGLLANITRRDLNDELIACRHCCNSVDGCNANLCTTRRSHDLHCLRCTDAIKADHCEEVEVCSSYQSCYVTHPYNFNIGERRIEMGCMGQMQCEAMKNAFVQSCSICCNNADYCNYNACDNFTLPTYSTPTTTKPTTTHPTTTQQVRTMSTTIKRGLPSVSCIRSPVTINFAVSCHVTGNPKPTVQWNFHEMPSHFYHFHPQNDPEIFTTHNETDYVLFVSHYDPAKHNGNWIFRAHNVYGYGIDQVSVP
ncbi:hypothetical protein ACF0H5_024480 [Mactra antiquata]